MTSIKQWAPESWQPFAAPQGPALVQLFSDLGYDKAADGMIQAYKAEPAVNLDMMKGALGFSAMTTDINHIWTSAGKMALMMDIGRNKPDKMPEEFGAVDFAH